MGSNAMLSASPLPAGTHPHDTLPVLHSQADSRRFLVVAPESQSTTWDLLRDGSGRRGMK